MTTFFFKYLVLVVPALLRVAFLTLLERKVLSLIGVRLGPNKVSLYGVFQPIADAVKLANKSINSLTNFSFFFYYVSACFIFIMRLCIFSCVYIHPSPIFVKFSVLLFLLVLGFNSFNGMLCGWSTFSKFSLIGRVRTVSQLISYEGVLYLCLFFIVVFYSGFRFSMFRFFNISFVFFLILPVLYIWFPTFLAELNRTPYDFSEGESELVRGFNTEFGSGGFTLIFLAEYGNIVFFCLITSILFFNATLFYPLILIFSVIWFRSVLPRYRFDKLISLAWKFFIPFLTFFYILVFLFFF